MPLLDNLEVDVLTKTFKVYKEYPQNQGGSRYETSDSCLISSDDLNIFIMEWSKFTRNKNKTQLLNTILFFVNCVEDHLVGFNIAAQPILKKIFEKFRTEIRLTPMTFDNTESTVLLMQSGYAKKTIEMLDEIKNQYNATNIQITEKVQTNNFRKNLLVIGGVIVGAVVGGVVVYFFVLPAVPVIMGGAKIVLEAGGIAGGALAFGVGAQQLKDIIVGKINIPQLKLHAKMQLLEAAKKLSIKRAESKEEEESEETPTVLIQP